MTRDARHGKSSIGELAPAWRALEASAAVKLRTIRSRRHYDSMVKFLNGLLDEIGDRESHALVGLLDVVTTLLSEYEQRHTDMHEATPADVLRLMMEQHELRQVDLAALFGSQSNVSEILNGKRSINARQARALAERFGVSVGAFI
ncbi:MAG: helix-turn-helix domain-containing protein [Gammaproteobacteria bacterium]|nr:helix-turn-helix domain-containing protein [Gammaproteobacteria bacterium]